MRTIVLLAVLIPLLFMGDVVGRLFHEFAITLASAIVISAVVSLTLVPMLCAKLLRHHAVEEHAQGRIARVAEGYYNRLVGEYERLLDWVLDHQPLTMIVFLVTVCLTALLYVVIPKGFFPQQDTGRLNGSIQADQDTSFQAMQKKLAVLIKTVMDDPAVESATGFLGGSANSGRMFVALKPPGERDVSADQVIARLRGKLSHVPGAALFLSPVQDVRVGGRMGGAQYQYTLQADDAKELFAWAPRILRSFRQVRERGVEAYDDGTQLVVVDVESELEFSVAEVLDAIDDTGVDTYSDERFFSYRRSVHRKEPDYGRHVHAIVLERE